MFWPSVAEKRKASSDTSATWRRSDAGSTERTSAPSTSTAPRSTSYRRGTSSTNEVLPEPVGPTSATVRPGSTSTSTSRSTGSPPSYEKVTPRSSTRPSPAGSGGAPGGG